MVMNVSLDAANINATNILTLDYIYGNILAGSVPNPTCKS